MLSGKFGSERFFSSRARPAVASFRALPPVAFRWVTKYARRRFRCNVGIRVATVLRGRRNFYHCWLRKGLVGEALCSPNAPRQVANAPRVLSIILPVWLSRLARLRASAEKPLSSRRRRSKAVKKRLAQLSNARPRALRGRGSLAKAASPLSSGPHAFRADDEKRGDYPPFFRCRQPGAGRRLRRSAKSAKRREATDRPFLWRLGESPEQLATLTT